MLLYACGVTCCCRHAGCCCRHAGCCCRHTGPTVERDGAHEATVPRDDLPSPAGARRAGVAQGGVGGRAGGHRPREGPPGRLGPLPDRRRTQGAAQTRRCRHQVPRAAARRQVSASGSARTYNHGASAVKSSSRSDSFIVQNGCHNTVVGNRAECLILL